MAHGLRILCVYHTAEENYLEPHPEDALRGHQVTCVTTYTEAKKFITDPKRGIPSFDVVLADVAVPGGSFGAEEDNFPFCVVLLQPHIDAALIRGFGIFVPEYFETTFDSCDGFASVVASKECLSFTGARDWSKLLDLVCKTLDDHKPV